MDWVHHASLPSPGQKKKKMNLLHLSPCSSLEGNECYNQRQTAKKKYIVENW